MSVLYRYVTSDTISLDGVGLTAAFEVREYSILKRTPRGAWIHVDGFGRKFVNLHSTKQFAYEDKAAALVSLKARKRAHVRILRARLESAERACALAEGLV